MLERIANSRTFLSFVLAGMTGLFLFFFYPVSTGQSVSAIHCPQGPAGLFGSRPKLHPVSIYHSVLCLFHGTLRSLRPELSPQAEAEGKLPAAVSQSEFQGRSISRGRRNSSPNKNQSWNRSSMADCTRERTVYRHWDLWRNRNGEDELLYASICGAVNRI